MIASEQDRNCSKQLLQDFVFGELGNISLYIPIAEENASVLFSVIAGKNIGERE